jgi:hypothetical protein
LHLLSALERRSPRWAHDLEGARDAERDGVDGAAAHSFEA